LPLTGRVGDWFADIKTLQQRDLIGMLLDQLRPSHQHHFSISRRHCRPYATFERGPRDFNGAIRIFYSAIRHVGELLTIGRIYRRTCLSGQGVLVLAVNERTALDFEACRLGFPILRGFIQHARAPLQ
jgi:hypothetical protein